MLNQAWKRPLVLAGAVLFGTGGAAFAQPRNTADAKIMFNNTGHVFSRYDYGYPYYPNRGYYGYYRTGPIGAAVGTAAGVLTGSAAVAMGYPYYGPYAYGYGPYYRYQW
ncbi:MAG TPA: hypothetical protein VKV77_04975 [Methylovirgula sp.]|nr:hypothetical protein [Methylovirgula sp.]